MKMHYAHTVSSGRMAQIVGAFVLLPLLGLIVVGFFMAKAEHLFEEKYPLQAHLSKSYGLEPGQAVVMAGIPIGRVQEVSFDPKGTIHVVLQVLRQYQDKVRADSVISIAKSGLLVGQVQVQVAMGSLDKPVLQDGATIQAEEPRDMAAIIDEVQPVIASVQRTLLRFEEVTKDVHTAVQTASHVLANVEEASRQLPAVVASVQRTAAAVERTTATLPQLTGSVQKTLTTVDQIAGDVRLVSGKLPAVTSAAQEAVYNIRATTDALKGLTREVPPLIRSAHEAVDDVNLILRGAKKTFPVNSMIKNAEAEEAGRTGSGLNSLRGDQLNR